MQLKYSLKRSMLKIFLEIFRSLIVIHNLSQAPVVHRIFEINSSFRVR